MNFRSYYLRRTLKLVLPLTAFFIAVALSCRVPYISEYVYARGIARLYSVVLQPILSLIPLSVLELSISVLIIAAVALILFIIFDKNFNGYSQKIERILVTVLVVVMCGITLSAATGTALYKRYEIYEPLGIEKTAADKDVVYAAAEYYIRELAAASEGVARDDKGCVISPYTFAQLNDILNDEYAKLTDDYFLHGDIRLKQITMSKAMTYTYITGVYIPALGEGSINTNVPAYTLPVTMAHEMAHSKGVIRENEANAMAYYIALKSSDPYIRYCGLMEIAVTIFSHVAGDTERKALLELFPYECRLEYTRATQFYNEYDTFVNDVSNFINNMYLKGSGVKDGTVSYSMTDGFLVSMYMSEQKKDGGN